MQAKVKYPGQDLLVSPAQVYPAPDYDHAIVPASPCWAAGSLLSSAQQDLCFSLYLWCQSLLYFRE